MAFAAFRRRLAEKMTQVIQTMKSRRKPAQRHIAPSPPPPMFPPPDDEDEGPVE